MRCPRCKHDIRDNLILSAAGTICAKRRARLKSDKAREMQKKSTAAKKAKAK